MGTGQMYTETFTLYSTVHSLFKYDH